MTKMQTIPLRSKELMRFTPDALAELAEPPVFKLKAPTRGDRHDMQYALLEAGLRKHSEEQHREATVDELCRMWECVPTDEQIERLRSFWAAVDSYDTEIENYLIEVQAAQESGEEAPQAPAPFEHPDLAHVEELSDRLIRSSARIRRMRTDNIRFEREVPRFAVAHCIADWSGLTTPARFEDGVLKMDALGEMEEELEDRFGELGSAALLELQAAALGRFFIKPTTEKKLRIGACVSADPERFQGSWVGVTEWDLPGLGCFSRNPRRLVDEQSFALIRIYRQCDRGMSGHVWPDGRGLLDQPNLLVDAWDVIGDALHKAEQGKDQ